jgi:hypothetical protein
MDRAVLKFRSGFAAAIWAIGAVAVATLAATPAAAQNLLQNGSFEQTTAASSGLKINGTLANWTNNNWYSGGNPQGPGYNFLYFPGQTNVGLPLWGPIPNSPDGGNFVGMDGAYEQGVLSQTVTGLTAGALYYVSFDFAGAQQSGFTGATTEQFAVDFTAGGTAPLPNYTCSTAGVQCTTVLQDASHGFTGWNTAGFTFLATSSTETLSFLAIGTPNGEPPFSLLDGVSLQLPEPSSLVLVGGGLATLLAARARRRRAAG